MKPETRKLNVCLTYSDYNNHDQISAKDSCGYLKSNNWKEIAVWTCAYTIYLLSTSPSILTCSPKFRSIKHAIHSRFLLNNRNFQTSQCIWHILPLLNWLSLFLQLTYSIEICMKAPCKIQDTVRKETLGQINWETNLGQTPATEKEKFLHMLKKDKNMRKNTPPLVTPHPLP